MTKAELESTKRDFESTKEVLESTQNELGTMKQELVLKQEELESKQRELVSGQQDLKSKEQETNQLRQLAQEKDDELRRLKIEQNHLREENHTLRGRAQAQSLVKAEVEAANILHRSEMVRPELESEFVKSLDEIKELSGDVIREMLSPTGYTKFKEAIKYTMDFDSDINKIILEDDKSDFKLNKELMEKLQLELASWRNLRDKIKEFKANLEKQAKERMIKVNQYEILKDNARLF